MIVAYQISPHHIGAFMLGEDTFRPPDDGGFYDWRFGKDGLPHPATCHTCGRKTDPNYINPHFRVKKRRWDIGSTYDGYHIVSSRFRQFCEQHNWSCMEFLPLPSDADFFVLRLSKVLAFDSERRNTRFEKPCPECKAYFNVTGANPVFLRGLNEPVRDGFFRTDLEFASGHEQHPLILVGVETVQQIAKQKFGNYALHSVTA